VGRGELGRARLAGFQGGFPFFFSFIFIFQNFSKANFEQKQKIKTEHTTQN